MNERTAIWIGGASESKRLTAIRSDGRTSNENVMLSPLRLPPFGELTAGPRGSCGGRLRSRAATGGAAPTGAFGGGSDKPETWIPDRVGNGGQGRTEEGGGPIKAVLASRPAPRRDTRTWHAKPLQVPSGVGRYKSETWIPDRVGNGGRGKNGRSSTNSLARVRLGISPQSSAFYCLAVIPARSPTTLTNDCPVGMTILELVWRDSVTV